MSKKDEFGESQGIQAAEQVYDACVLSLKNTVSGMKPPIPEPLHVKVSGIISHSLFGRCHG